MSNNLKRIKDYSSRVSFKLKANKFIQMTDEEMSSLYLSEINIGKLKNFTNSIRVKYNSSNTYSRLTNRKFFKQINKNSWVNLNWTSYGYVSPVNNQGACGACYAFSAAEVVESALAIKYNMRTNLVTLSKQQIIDCTSYLARDSRNLNYFNYGCNGGSIFSSLLYILNNGLMKESDYPYISQV